MNLWDDRSWTPMLLKQVDKPFDSDEYLYEIKFDGIRAIIYVSPECFNIYNRFGKDITYLYPELEKIKELVNEKTIFDGEIIALENGQPSFSKIQQRAHLKDKYKIKSQIEENPVLFVCFDILFSEKNLINLTLRKRKMILEKYQENDVFILSKYIEKEGEKLFASIVELKLEGIVAKNNNSLYEINTRSDSWLKIKNIQGNYFYIGGYIDKKENHTISLLLGEFKDKKLLYVGKVTLGKKHNLYKKILSQKIKKKTPFENFADTKYCYIEPDLKCKVSYLERTKNNHLRHPVLVIGNENT